MKKRNYLGFIAILASALFVLSCEKDDVLDDGKSKTDETKFLSISDQQELLSNSALDVASLIDFSEYEEFNALIDTILFGRKDLMGFFESSKIIMSDSIFAGKYAMIREIIRKDTLNLDLTRTAVKVMYEFEDSIIRIPLDSGRVEIDTVINVKGVKITEPADGSTQLGATYLGQELIMSMKLQDNSLDNVLSLDMETAPDSINPLFYIFSQSISIPDLLALNITLNGKPLFDFSLTIDTDLSIDFPFGEDGTPDFNGLKFNQFSKFVAETKLKGGSFEFLSKLEFIDPDEGFRMINQSKIDGKNLIQATYNLDASLGDLFTADGIDRYMLMSLAMNPALLRGMDGTLALGEDVTIKARIDNPFGCNTITSTISGLLFSQNELSKDDAQPFLDSLSNYASLDVFFKGYTDSQAKLKFVYEDSEMYQKMEDDTVSYVSLEVISKLISKLATPQVGEMVTGMIDRMNIMPVIVARNDKGEEVYMRVDQYLSGIDLKTPVMLVGDKLGESLRSLPTLIMLLMLTFIPAVG